MKKLSVILLVCCLFFTFCGCDKQMVSSDNEMKIDNLAAQNEVFASSLAGNVYMTKEGNVLTFYRNGTAAYDYQNMIGENHHYDYDVYIVEQTDDKLIMEVFEKENASSEKIHTEDSITSGPEEMVYNITDGTVKFYKLYQPAKMFVDEGVFKNSYGSPDTKCDNEGCTSFIAPSGNTKYCIEHTAICVECDGFINIGESYCANCLEKRANPQNSTQKDSTEGECYWCNGTGMVKYYYGDSDLEAILNGHEPSWYGQCGSCQGTGRKR